MFKIIFGGHWEGWWRGGWDGLGVEHLLEHQHNHCYDCLRAGRLDGLGTVEEMALARAGAWATLLTTLCTSMALKTFLLEIFPRRYLRIAHGSFDPIACTCWQCLLNSQIFVNNVSIRHFVDLVKLVKLVEKKISMFWNQRGILLLQLWFWWLHVEQGHSLFKRQSYTLLPCPAGK